MFVYGIYPNEELAAKALRGVVDAGFPVGVISGLMHREDDPEQLPTEEKNRASRGELLGSTLDELGGTDLAPTGGFLAAGTLLAALHGGTGFGAIEGLGFWRDEVELMNRQLSEGAVVVAVETVDDLKPKAERTLREAGAEVVGASRSLDAAVGEN